MIICIAAFLIGILLALFIPIVIDFGYISYMSIFVLYLAWASAEAIRRMLLGKDNILIFISGLFCGLIFVMLFVTAGKWLDLDIYTVCTLLIGAALVKSCYGIFRYYAEKHWIKK